MAYKPSEIGGNPPAINLGMDSVKIEIHNWEIVEFLFWITHPSRWLGALSKRDTISANRIHHYPGVCPVFGLKGPSSLILLDSLTSSGDPLRIGIPFSSYIIVSVVW